MGLRIVSSSPAVTLEEAKEHLRIDGSADGSSLNHLISASSDFVERETRTAIGPMSLVLTLDRFPVGDCIQLPRPPLASVQSVKYLDCNDVQQALDPALYLVDTSAKPGRIVLKPHVNWPHTSWQANSVEVAFTAGYPANAIPSLLTQAVLLTVGAWFECREGAVDRRFDELPIPFAVSSIINSHMFPEVVG